MKKKFLYSILIISLIILLLCITGCSTSENNNVEQTDSNITNEENSSSDIEDNSNIALNTELSNMVSVALKAESNSTNNGFDYTVYAINQDGTDIELLQESTNSWKIIYNEYIDYIGGKIYLAQASSLTDTSSIYSIDLTLGDGNYSLEKIVTVEDMDINSFAVFDDGKVYIGSYNEISKSYILESYDLGTGKFETIDTSLTGDGCKYDKKNKNIAYSTQSGTTYCIKTYNIETKEITTICTENTQTTVSDANDGYVLYSTNNNLYLYDTETKENATLIGIGASATIMDGKVFFEELKEYTDEPIEIPVRLSVYENGEITKLRDYVTTGGYDYLLDLGTGNWQVRWSSSQDDSSTWKEQWYIIDSETYEITTNDKGYNAIHIVKDFEKKKLSLQEKDYEKISLEEAEKIVDEKWGLDTVDASELRSGATITGKYIDCTVFDKEGMEYYVFSYYMNAGAYTSHVQTIFLSVDGKKYKITAEGDDFSDGDVLQEFGSSVDLEEGEI